MAALQWQGGGARQAAWQPQTAPKSPEKDSGQRFGVKLRLTEARLHHRQPRNPSG